MLDGLASDRSQLSSMSEQARAAIGSEAIEAVADRGYYSGEEIVACEQAGVTVYLPKPITSGLNVKGRFGKQDFVYVAADDVCLCPAGEQLIYHYTNEEDGKTLRRDILLTRPAVSPRKLLSMLTIFVLPRHPLIGMVLIAVLLATAEPALTADVTGQASVIDGDTIEIHGTRIRLWGIDAPEGTQLCRGEDSLQYRCGAKAANDLDAFIARRPVSCTPISRDQYGRTVATCTVEATDLGEWLVSNGLALELAELLEGHVR